MVIYSRPKIKDVQSLSKIIKLAAAELLSNPWKKPTRIELALSGHELIT